jgi:hypothetical protein
MDEGTRLPLASNEGLEMRDRDVMNLLDQLELYALRVGEGKASQKDYWLFVYKSMKSGLLMTKAMEKYLEHKLQGLGTKHQDYG